MPKIKNPLSKTRTMEVIRLVCEGLSNREVGERLGVCEKTIKAYLYWIYKAYGVKRRIQLYLLAKKEGWL